MTSCVYLQLRIGCTVVLTSGFGYKAYFIVSNDCSLKLVYVIFTVSSLKYVVDLNGNLFNQQYVQE